MSSIPRRWAAAEPSARTAPKDGMAGLFAAAFAQSKNAMVLVDDQRLQVDVNAAYVRILGYRRDELLGQPIYELVVGGSQASPEEWKAALDAGKFTGEVELRCADGDRLRAQWAATTEVVTGGRLVLFVALSTSRWGTRFRRTVPPASAPGTLSRREHEIVRLVALGSTGPEIADELQISHATVRTHVRNAMAKVDARSRAHLVAKALGDGLVLQPRGAVDPSPPSGRAG